MLKTTIALCTTPTVLIRHLHSAWLSFLLVLLSSLLHARDHSQLHPVHHHNVEKDVDGHDGCQREEHVLDVAVVEVRGDVLAEEQHDDREQRAAHGVHEESEGDGRAAHALRHLRVVDVVRRDGDHDTRKGHEQVLRDGRPPRNVVHHLVAVVIDHVLRHAARIHVREQGLVATDDLVAPGPDHGHDRRAVAGKHLSVATGRFPSVLLVQRVDDLLHERHKDQHADGVEHLDGGSRHLRGERAAAKARVGLLHDGLVVASLVLADPPEDVEGVERQDADHLLDAVHELGVESAADRVLGGLHELGALAEVDPQNRRDDNHHAARVRDVVAHLAVVRQHRGQDVEQEGSDVQDRAEHDHLSTEILLGVVDDDLDHERDRLLGGRHVHVALARSVEQSDKDHQHGEPHEVDTDVAVVGRDGAEAVDGHGREHGIADERPDVGDPVLDAEEEGLLRGRRVGRELVASVRDHERPKADLRDGDAEEQADVEDGLTHSEVVVDDDRQRGDHEEEEAERVERGGRQQRLELAKALVGDVAGHDAHELAERVIRELHRGRALVGPTQLLEKVLERLADGEARDLLARREDEEEDAHVLEHIGGIPHGSLVPEFRADVARDGRRQRWREHRRQHLGHLCRRRRFRK
ncbi:hypothetical protein PRIC1_004632 [Phytophthora ramorum]